MKRKLIVMSLLAGSALAGSAGASWAQQGPSGAPQGGMIVAQAQPTPGFKPSAPPPPATTTAPRSGTTSPRAGGFPLELALPLLGGGAAALGGGVLLLRRGRKA